MDEWFILSEMKCLIPGNDTMSIAPITASDSLDGQLLTFSFVIKAENEMRCYVIWNGQSS